VHASNMASKGGAKQLGISPGWEEKQGTNVRGMGKPPGAADATGLACDQLLICCELLLWAGVWRKGD
jgi:hypothetical protein